MELRDYVRVLRRSWLAVLLMTLLGMIGAAIFSFVVTPEYEAESRVYVSTQSAADLAELGQGSTYSQQIVQSFVEAATTSAVLTPVIEEVGLDETPGELASRVAVTNTEGTVIIDLVVTDESPEQAADIANALTSSLADVVEDVTPQTDGENPVMVTTLQEATVPTSSVFPTIPLNLALGLALGLGVGVGLALLREALDTKVRGERDIELITDKPILGHIAYDPKVRSRPLIVHSAPHAPRAEAFRVLRTNLQFIDVDEKLHSVVVTSSLEAEGKTTTAANLAITMRDAGYRVLIIDADLRRPALARYFGLEGAIGVTDVLLGQADLADAVQLWGAEGEELSVLPSGTVPPNPSELLGSRLMKGLLNELSTYYDLIILDAPPLLPVTDAAVLTSRTNGAIFVTAAGRVKRDQVKAAIGNVEAAGGQLLGIVATMLPTKGPDAYNYGQYGYAYVVPDQTSSRRKRVSRR